jgi:glycosyltransferase involved in cell wall biosynthesis
MKILLVSMHSIHAIRWIENLKDTDHELYWFDVTNKGRLNTIDKVTQFIDWKKRKIPAIKGEYTLYKKFPEIHSKIKHLFEVTESEALEKIILEVNPDVIHSFEMQSCSYPIVKAMNKFPNLKWMYSCWGNDLFYFKNFKSHLQKIKAVLKRVDYLHTDCERDYSLAKELEFKGKHIGVIPGGSGYNLNELAQYKTPVLDRNIILIKGYQHIFGRALNVIKALENSLEHLANFEVVVFGAHQEVIDYIKEKNLPFKVFHRTELSQLELIKLMGKSMIYIGNNISDGMPNTLLEAMIMNAFPIQSNPGNATAEIIEHEKNGLLINNPNDIKNIESLIVAAINDKNRIAQAAIINTEIAKQRLDYTKIQPKIVDLYNHL